MSERARQMGILDDHLKRAMVLVRALRIQAIKDDLDPRATRIALLFAVKCDAHHAERTMHPVAFAALETIAEELYQMVKEGQ